MERKKHPLDVNKRAVRSGQMRKLAKDGKTWTPTEKLKRNRMLKQFTKKGRKGVGLSGTTPEYRQWYDSMDWGSCKCRLIESGGKCGHCLAKENDDGRTP